MPATLYAEIDTPALLVDLDVMERNIARMAAMAAAASIKLRPHIKTHKSTWIAERQLAAGACGITVAKLGEAEVMVAAGIHDILLAYPVVGEAKLRRLERLLAQADIILSTDSVEAAAGMARAAERAGRKALFYVDIDTGLQRLGWPAGAPAAKLAWQISRIPNAEVVGLMSHAGHVGKGTSQAEVAGLATAAAQALVDTAELLRAEGMAIREVSPGSTVAAAYDAWVPGVTEMRPGTYVFNDANGVRRWAAGEDDCALRVLTTVVSGPGPGRAVVDAGSKTLSSDPPAAGYTGYGIVTGRPDIIVDRLSEEHGVLRLPAGDPPGSPPLQVGDRLSIIPNHVCPVVNLADVLYGVRQGRVEREIPVAARGRNR